MTSTADTIAVDGGVTLREALASVDAGASVNADVVPAGAYGVNDTIAFNIAGCPSVCTITLTGGSLGILNKPAVIDGYTQPGASPNTLAVGDNAVIKIEIDGNQAVSSGGSLLFLRGGDTTIRGLNMHNAGVGNLNFIGGSNYAVEGNFFGTTPDGTAAATPGGNGTAVITTAANLRVGGTAPAQRNVMSALTAAVSIGQFATDTLIQGNYIGTDKTGNAAIGNLMGIAAPTAGGSSVGNITIGGTTSGAGNVISGSTSLFGIEVDADGPTVGTVVIQGNMIGTNALGTAAIGNTGGWIHAVQRSGGSIASLVIGGTAAGAGNVISGNGFGGFGQGIFLDNVTNATIQGNAIGTNAAGTAAIPNFASGILVGGPVLPQNVLIGGSSAGARNIISGNGLGGIYVNFGQATVEGNYIGVAADGVTPIGNVGAAGVKIDSAVGTIGGTTPGQGNVIANNHGGVDVVIGTATIRPTSNATILGNSIYDNSIELGINLDFPQAVTPNDPGDADVGANNLQNFPVITTAATGGGNVTLSGSLNSTANTTFRVEFFGNPACSTSGFGEGKHFLGFQNVTTDGAGNVAFGPLTFALPAGDTVFTATATDPAGNTSEFSGCKASGAATSADVSVTKSAAASVAAGANLTYTLVVTNAGPSAASNVSLSDTLPPGTTFVSISAPGGWSVTTPAAGGTGAVTASSATLASGATATFTLVVNVDAATPNGTSIANTASATGSTADPNAANNTTTATTTVTTAAASADVSVTKVVSGSTTAGGTIAYTIVVANAGPSAASNVVLTDALPPNTTFVAVTASPGWTVTTPAVGSTGTIMASNASVASGASASFAITVAVNASVASGTTISNTASVSSTADANAGNNSATASTSVTAGGQPNATATPIPTLSEWLLVLLALAVLVMGAGAARRR